MRREVIGTWTITRSDLISAACWESVITASCLSQDFTDVALKAAQIVSALSRDRSAHISFQWVPCGRCEGGFRSGWSEQALRVNLLGCTTERRKKLSPTSFPDCCWFPCHFSRVCASTSACCREAVWEEQTGSDFSALWGRRTRRCDRIAFPI